MTPRVKNIINNYYRNNLRGVNNYLSQNGMIVDPSTWAGQVKKLIEEKNFNTAKELIEITAYKFINLYNK